MSIMDESFISFSLFWTKKLNIFEYEIISAFFSFIKEFKDIRKETTDSWHFYVYKELKRKIFSKIEHLHSVAYSWNLCYESSNSSWKQIALGIALMSISWTIKMSKRLVPEILDKILIIFWIILEIFSYPLVIVEQ